MWEQGRVAASLNGLLTVSPNTLWTPGTGLNIIKKRLNPACASSISQCWCNWLLVRTWRFFSQIFIFVFHLIFFIWRFRVVRARVESDRFMVCFVCLRNGQKHLLLYLFINGNFLITRALTLRLFFTKFSLLLGFMEFLATTIIDGICSFSNFLKLCLPLLGIFHIVLHSLVHLLFLFSFARLFHQHRCIFLFSINVIVLLPCATWFLFLALIVRKWNGKVIANGHF